MDKILSINPVYIVIGIVFVTGYYFCLYKYEQKLKNRKYIKNIDDSVTSVKNIHIFDDNFESAPSYNKVKIKPTTIPNNNGDDNSDWRKTLGAIQAQADELNTNNSLDQYLLENDIDTES